MKWTAENVRAALFTLNDPCPHAPETVRGVCPECIADALNTMYELGRDFERDAARRRKP